MHCFYIEGEGPTGDEARLTRDESRHAARVLRLHPGDAVCAMDGRGGRYSAEIASIDESGVTVRLITLLDDNEPPVRVTLYQGVPKADKLDFIAQKLTELGACALVPVRMERCVARPDARDGAKRRERLERISLEAAKQCRRASALEIAEPLTWQQAIGRMRRHDLVLVPWEDASGRRMADAFARRPDAADIGIVIGAEGGMSVSEVDALEAAGATTVTLGPRILRAETAAVASVALAMQLWGDI